MSAEPALRLVGCEECERMRKQSESLKLELEATEQEIKRLRRVLKARERQDYDRTQRHPHYEVAERLFGYWKQECGHPRAQFGARRAKALLARLDQYTAREVAMAIKGAAVAAYVDENGVRHDDIELICRDEVKLEKFIERYERWKEQRT